MSKNKKNCFKKEKHNINNMRWSPNMVPRLERFFVRSIIP